MALVLKTGRAATSSWVRIPRPPPVDRRKRPLTRSRVRPGASGLEQRAQGAKGCGQAGAQRVARAYRQQEPADDHRERRSQCEGLEAKDQQGWGGLIEVVEPESVRAELGRIGAELIERYEAVSQPSAPSAMPHDGT
jgi:hypothetical protein